MAELILKACGKKVLKKFQMRLDKTKKRAKLNDTQLLRKLRSCLKTESCDGAEN